MRKPRQKGYTLVEVMVAISIALFLMGGALLMVQHTRNAFKAQNQLSQLQESERMAMALITDAYEPHRTSLKDYK